MSHSARHLSSAAVWLFPIALRVVAIGFVVFFGAGFLALIAGTSIPPALGGLVRWGQHGKAYELMICSIYVVWAGFLWCAAKAPVRNKMFLDFTILANAAHFGTMLVEGMVMPGEHHHLHGDVLLGWAALLPLAVLWPPVRRTNEHPQRPGVHQNSLPH
jgi:hypothetical protein